ncbi:4Fe-4S binding protein [Veillonella intestinalis]|uniref:4Fe-4S binding protein n=1 Tax=Veillonella intestinalis TaxID=2941341 RepID=UPI00203A582D|nr:4Fe-4S binding protein [Veillonella intestinalis]
MTDTNTYVFTFQIDGQRCVKCGACAMDCPVQIIIEKPQQFFIEAGCIGCGDCYEICPVGAIIKQRVDEI